MKKTREEIIKQHNEEKKKAAELWNNSIPGLNIDEIEKEKLRDKFQSWAVHFQKKLFTRGLDGLIEQYSEVVQNVKTQSCPHTKDGTRRTGEEYFSCCGISYEYKNDISKREALQIIIDIVNTDLSNSIINRIYEIDMTLKDLIIRNNTDPDFNINWWKKYLPYGVRE